MIITCEKCSTKFNLDESILKKEGSKVRCSMCRHVFKAYPQNDDYLEAPNLLNSKTVTSEHQDISKNKDQLKIDNDFTKSDTLKTDEGVAIDIRRDSDLKSEGFQTLDNNLMIKGDFIKTVDDTLPLESEMTFDDDLKIDDDFTINSEFGADKISTPDPKVKHGDAESLEQEKDLELDFSFDDNIDDPAPDKLPSKPVIKPVDTDNGLELDMDFSLDDDMDIPVPQQKSSFKPVSKTVDTDNDIELDLDFSLDEEIDTPAPDKLSSKPVSKPVDTDNGLELDMDFSLDDDMDIPVPQQKSSSKPVSKPVDTDNGLELDMDFSLDDDMDVSTTQSSRQPATPSLKKESPKKEPSFELDDDLILELDFDFSLDKNIDTPAPVSQKSSSKNTTQIVDMDDSIELDMDFSNDDALSMDEVTTSEQGLEFEIEDGSELDFDFSSENESADIKTSTINKTEIKQSTASISPMDMDFSTDDEIDSNEYMFDDDYAETDDTISDIEKNINTKQPTENKPSLKSDSEQTTLGGQPIRANIQSTTLLSKRPNLFEESVLFEKERKFATGKIILIPIVLLILAIAGYAASIMTGIKIPYLSDIKIPYIDKIMSPQPEPVKLTPDQKTVIGKFITNTISGTLFVITGQVTNHSKTPCKDIKIEGTLLATNKAKVKNKIVLCGNVISEEKLKTLDMNAINSILYSSDGNKKFTVEPGKSIPFMVVFSNFPDNLENFTVAVTDFKRVTGKE